MDPYTIPTIYLPALSDLPLLSEVPSTLRCAMRQSIDNAEKLLVQLDNHIQISSCMCEALLPLSKALDGVVQMLIAARQSLHGQAAPGLNGNSKKIATADMSKPMAEACTIYDDYFGMMRVSSMEQLQFTAQVVSTCQNVLHDLPYTLLDRMQFTTLIRTMKEMLRVLSAGDRSLNVDVHSDSKNSICTWTLDRVDSYFANQQQRFYDKSWRDNAIHKDHWAEQVATYRWKVGHHFFNLCAIFCRHALQQVQRAITEESLDGGAKQLQNATQFLRGTTAAMWYASDFPAHIYQAIIRPSMVMPRPPAGFSGDQNADYNRMKEQKEDFKAFLHTCYGPSFSALPASLYQALRDFYEADIQDIEHHVIIAANKVGTDQSLAQKEWLAELPTSPSHAQSAVDILREMAEMRRREYMLD
ncbi:MAG: hypothetical protein AAF702_37960 [Chloroflexota bacterium]